MIYTKFKSLHQVQVAGSQDIYKYKLNISNMAPCRRQVNAKRNLTFSGCDSSIRLEVRTRRVDMVRTRIAEVVKTRRSEVFRTRRAEVVKTRRPEVFRTTRAEAM